MVKSGISEHRRLTLFTEQSSVLSYIIRFVAVQTATDLITQRAVLHPVYGGWIVE